MMHHLLVARSSGGWRYAVRGTSHIRQHPHIVHRTSSSASQQPAPSARTQNTQEAALATTPHTTLLQLETGSTLVATKKEEPYSKVDSRLAETGSIKMMRIVGQGYGPRCRLRPLLRSFSNNSASDETKSNDPMPLSKLYRYLDLETFRDTELNAVFNRISRGDQRVNRSNIEQFLLERIRVLEKENGIVGDETDVEEHRRKYASRETTRFLRVWDNGDAFDRQTFVNTILVKASQVDVARALPVTVSMLLVGSSVGVLTPAMPFVVEELGLTASQYGFVVSAFPLAKMAWNIPSAIAVERYGRKPFMSNSLVLIAIGVGGIGLASHMEELYLCRLLTGAGVSLLSAAGTLMVTDLSNPLNRASTMAPIMSAFAAGTALGPAIGGVLVDQVGLHPTFYMVGVSYLGVAALNRVLLTETKAEALVFPWQNTADRTEDESLSASVSSALAQWSPLLQDRTVRSILLMNGFYWISLAGSQMTLLPLILTDSSGLAMTATQVGQVYMGMSLVQIVGNPVFARAIDRIGKPPAIVAGCTLISASMASLGYCGSYQELALALGIWSMGSSMLSTAPLAYISDRVEDGKRAQAIALMRTCGDVGFLIGASATGLYADWVGSLDIAMQSSAGLLLTATTWFGVRQLMGQQLHK